MSPKRGFFSLNIESNAEHFDQRSTEHHSDGTESEKVIETKRTPHGSTDFSAITKPFEKTVNRVIQDVVRDTGKKVEKLEGDIHDTTQSSTSTFSHSSADSNLNVKNKSIRRYLERRYDISDL